ncbi:unnamed protein product [Caenorhabditis auriculariae]|uniref:Uncharacterized protein n=1 Tax=Caenorhabditis auriculariae TaxID=2777116 RepID=A0A8S1HMD8_9PELO|nr:unnamed protein product [Caenorhabditis auriculariae]
MKVRLIPAIDESQTWVVEKMGLKEVALRVLEKLMPYRALQVLRRNETALLLETCAISSPSENSYSTTAVYIFFFTCLTALVILILFPWKSVEKPLLRGYMIGYIGMVILLNFILCLVLRPVFYFPVIAYKCLGLLGTFGSFDGFGVFTALFFIPFPLAFTIFDNAQPIYYLYRVCRESRKWEMGSNDVHMQNFVHLFALSIQVFLHTVFWTFPICLLGLIILVGSYSPGASRFATILIMLHGPFSLFYVPFGISFPNQSWSLKIFHEQPVREGNDLEMNAVESPQPSTHYDFPPTYEETMGIGFDTSIL